MMSPSHHDANLYGGMMDTINSQGIQSDHHLEQDIHMDLGLRQSVS